MQDLINEFWEELIDKLSLIDETHSDYINIIQSAHDKLVSIDPVLCFAIMPRIINMNDYDFGNPLYSSYLQKMNIVRYDLCISASGDSTKFDLIDKIVSAGNAYQIPEDWNIVKLCCKMQDAYGLIPSKPGEMISISMMEYKLQKLDDGYHLMLYVDEKYVQTIQTQEEIYQLRNGVLLWLESLIGEYHTAKSIPYLTILPASVNDQVTQNGVYLTPELNEIFHDKCCALCTISEINSKLTNHSNMLEYPYINNLLCDHCFTVLKNFRPMYIKLRAKFSIE
jgi:hypothetical protein